MAEGAPRYDGHHMACRLAGAGIQTTLIADSAVFAMMARANKVHTHTRTHTHTHTHYCACNTHTCALQAAREVIIATALERRLSHRARACQFCDEHRVNNAACVCVCVPQVIVGAHAVLANGGVIAPCGIHMVALAAKQFSIPFVVLVGLHKLSPLFPHQPEVGLNGEKHTHIHTRTHPRTCTRARPSSAVRTFARSSWVCVCVCLCVFVSHRVWVSVRGLGSRHVG